MLGTDHNMFKYDTAVHITAAGLLQTATNTLPFWNPQFRSATTVLYLGTHFCAQYTTRHFLHIICASKSPDLCEPNCHLAANNLRSHSAAAEDSSLRKCDTVWLRVWFLTSQHHNPEDVNLEQPSCRANERS